MTHPGLSEDVFRKMQADLEDIDKEMDRLRDVNATVLAALKRAESHFRLLPSEFDEPGSVMAEMRAGIAKAEGLTP